MKINLPRQIHGKFGTLRGTVEVPDRYGKELIDAGHAKEVAKPKPKKSKDD